MNLLPLLAILPFVPLIALGLSEAPWLLERNTPERKLLLEMLRELGRHPDEWACRGLDYHHPCGVQFKDLYNFSLKLDGTTIEFPRDSKGGRILKRIKDAVAREEKRQTDLAALQRMTDAFNRLP